MLNGRFGPYIEFGKLNVKIPKGKEPAALTFEECKALAAIAEKEPKKKGFSNAKKPAAKVPATKAPATKTPAPKVAAARKPGAKKK